MEALAQYDFQGRTERELSFKKGDTLVVFSQVSTDWWEGAFKGKEGLIPDKYIALKTRQVFLVPISWCCHIGHFPRPCKVLTLGSSSPPLGYQLQLHQLGW